MLRIILNISFHALQMHPVDMQIYVHFSETSMVILCSVLDNVNDTRHSRANLTPLTAHPIQILNWQQLYNLRETRNRKANIMKLSGTHHLSLTDR